MIWQALVAHLGPNDWLALYCAGLSISLGLLAVSLQGVRNAGVVYAFTEANPSCSM